MISQTVGELEGREERREKRREDRRGGAKSFGTLTKQKSTRVIERERGCVVGVEKAIRIENFINILD